MQLNKLKKPLIFIIASAVLIILDQITKKYAENNFINSPFIIIKDALELGFTKNSGAAFGILQGKFYFFYVVTAFVILLIIYTLYKIDLNKKYMPLFICIILIFSGTIGNLIDRIRNNYVIDFIYFRLIDFPLFNLADSYITIGAILFIILFIFVYKEEDINYVFKNRE